MGRKCKDGRVPWMGRIPSNWTYNMLGNLFVPRKDRVSDKDYPPLSVGKMGVVPQLDTAIKTIDGDTRKLVKEGDFVINSRSVRRGSCGISDCDGSVSVKEYVLIPSKDIDVRYYNWIFHTEQFADEFYKWGHGIVEDFWTTQWQEMKRITLPVPPLSTQKHITDFLDRKCAEIDELIILQETMIPELKRYKRSVITETVTKGLCPNVPMKDSGVKCVGEIPCHWDMVSVPFVFHNLNYLRGPISSEKRERNNPQYDYYGASGIIDKIDNYNVDDKVLLIAVVGTNLKLRNLPLIYKAEGRFWVSHQAHILKPKKDDYDYMYYMLEALDYSDYITGSAEPVLSQERLSKVKVCVPPLAEQKSIANYLNKKCSEIDELIVVKQQKIEALKEYRKSVIFEYVIGRRKVSRT